MWLINNLSEHYFWESGRSILKASRTNTGYKSEKRFLPKVEWVIVKQAVRGPRSVWLEAPTIHCAVLLVFCTGITLIALYCNSLRTAGVENVLNIQCFENVLHS